MQLPGYQGHKNPVTLVMVRSYSVLLTRGNPKPVSRSSSHEINGIAINAPVRNQLTACPKIFDPMSSLKVGRATRSQPGFEQLAFGYDGVAKLYVRARYESHKRELTEGE